MVSYISVVGGEVWHTVTTEDRGAETGQWMTTYCGRSLLAYGTLPFHLVPGKGKHCVVCRKKEGLP